MKPLLSLSPEKKAAKKKVTVAAPAPAPKVRAEQSVQHVAAPPADLPAPAKALQENLVANLKQQISCLNLEVKYLKEGKGAGQRVDQSQTATVPANMPRSSLEALHSHGELLKNAEVLEKEVHELRTQFANREKEHQLEIAAMRQQMDGASSIKVASHLLVPRTEVEALVEKNKAEVQQARDMCSNEVVTLQKTIERMRLEARSAAAEVAATAKERDSILRDLMAHKDNLRNTQTNLDTLQKQYDQAMGHLQSEQEVRRNLETKVQEMQAELTKGQKEHADRLQARIDDLEKKHQDLCITVQKLTYENQQLNVVNNKQKDDVAALLVAKGVSQQVEDKLHATCKELEGKVTRLTEQVADVQSEREYYRIAADRLKVQNSVLEVKVSHSESKISQDKQQHNNLERQYCTALETLDSIRREMKQKEEVYKALDDNDTAIRKINKQLSDEMNFMRSRYEKMDRTLAETTAQMEADRAIVEKARSDHSMSLALGKLEKMKQEMRSILDAQMRMMHDLSQTVVEIPDSSVARTCRAPQDSSTQVHADPAPVAPASGDMGEHCSSLEYAVGAWSQVKNGAGTPPADSVVVTTPAAAAPL